MFGRLCCCLIFEQTKFTSCVGPEGFCSCNDRSVYMYVRMYAHVCIHIMPRKFLQAQEHVRTYMLAYVLVCMQANVHESALTCSCIRVRVFLVDRKQCVCMCAGTYVCMHATRNQIMS
jgi:hypothetical protein